MVSAEGIESARQPEIQQHREQRTAILAILVHVGRYQWHVNGRWLACGVFRFPCCSTTHA